MKHYFGLSEYYLRQDKRDVPIYYEPERLLNSHLLLCGMSGTGKTHQSVRLLESAADCGIEVDIFDVHEELECIRGAKAVKYSRATGYGYNPLVLDTDPHDGGVEKQADFIVGLIRQVTQQFGSKQEAALRNLIVDCYMSRGIFADKHSSWQRDEITEQQRERLIAERRWSDLRNYYPTLTDLLDYAEKKVMAIMFGGDNKAMSALEALTRANSRLQAAGTKFGRAMGEEEKKKLEEQRDVAEERCIEAYNEAIRSKPTREHRDLIKYDSKDVLISVVQRLQLVSSAGIFRSNAPDFGGSNARVHKIKSLSDEQQILFTKLRLRQIFDKCKKMGPTASGTELRHVAFLDEAPKYFTEDKSDIINVIARESRKFGLGLWCAAQEPTAFPESFLTNCGCTIFLGVHSKYWKQMGSMMRITENNLKFIKPKEAISVQLRKDGQADPPFLNALVPNPNVETGRRAASFDRR